MAADRAAAPEAAVRGLEELAGAWGVQTRWVDLAGTVQRVAPETLLDVLRALGAPVASAGDVERALAERREAAAGRLVEPVVVAWEGEPGAVDVRAGGRVEVRLALEDGTERAWAVDGGPVALPDDLPRGYHDLTVRAGGREATARVIRAPGATWDPGDRRWGVFLPLHALRTRKTRMIADLGDLRRLVAWTGSHGGAVVGTLPLLPTFLEAPFEPSPYVPVSRLFWNELFVDVAAAPGLARSEAARRLLEGADARARLRDARRGRLVDYRAAYAHQRAVLDALAASFFAEGARPDSWGAFLAAHPEAEAYAGFRAEREAAADGRDRQAAARTHVYAQWLAALQMDEVAAAGRAHGAGLYLDLPLGVHPGGFDAARWRGLFAPRVATGAPPDDFFTGGQNWGFPPLHPERVREDGYRYVAAAIGHLAAHADTLRLDHVMALHRLWWVPDGRAATDGAYVRYPAEEWWAVLAVESHRHRTEIVGEDLGTVPDEVREALARRRARRMVVLPFLLREDPEPVFAEIPELAAAHLDTHDMPPFAAWWKGLGAERRRAVAEALARAGALDPAAVDDVAASDRPRRALEAALRFVSNSEARLVVVNLEDLWLEERPQNEPGTTMAERPNWRRRARYAFETFREMPEVAGLLAEVDRLRKERPEEEIP